MTGIYAFALSPNDIIRPETLSERIDRMCAEARAEIADMARKALQELCPPESEMPAYTDAYQAVRAYNAYGVENHQIMLMRQAAMMNTTPWPSGNGPQNRMPGDYLLALNSSWLR